MVVAGLVDTCTLYSRSREYGPGTNAGLVTPRWFRSHRLQSCSLVSKPEREQAAERVVVSLPVSV
jgi:hypothetical protein